MLFNIITATLLGLSTLVTAAAVPAPALDPESVQRRHLDFRSSREDKEKSDTTIIDTTVVALSESSRNSEAQLIVAIQQTEVIRNGHRHEKRKLQDRVRRNHYRNKNKEVDTVIIIITNIVDIRVSNNKNNRYMRRVINNRGRKHDKNNNNREEVTVQITEIEAITIDSSNSNHDSQNHKHKSGKNKSNKNPANVLATATAAALASLQTVDPNAPFMQTNSSVLLPDGSSAPAYPNVELDPARILEENNEDAFVGSV